MKTARQIAEALEAFDWNHGSMITTALQLYADYMREQAEAAEIEAWCPERAPVPPRENADGTMTISCPPTPAGYARMAVMFTEAADSAKQAYAAYEKLTDRADDDEQEN